jgi:hypothetical protein
MVRKVRVHEDHKLPRHELEAVNVRGAEAELPWPLEDLEFLVAKDLLQLERNLVRAVGRRVLHDDDLVLERRLCKDVVEKADHKRQVLRLIV